MVRVILPERGPTSPTLILSQRSFPDLSQRLQCVTNVLVSRPLPLYGDTQEDQDQIRTFKDGKLKPDCFSEHRSLGFPPGCGVLLIMFNRSHNYVVDQLAVVNEANRFAKPRGPLGRNGEEGLGKI
jgi:hypothetical protein